MTATTQHTLGLADAVPVGMVAVTQDEFFRLLRDDRRDIMPTVEDPDCTHWRIVANREPWGWSAPGWLRPGEPKVWAVSTQVARTAGGAS